MARFAARTFQILGVASALILVVAAASLFILGPWLQYETPLTKADFIVPLAGDDHRFIKAAELYRGGYAPTLLLSNARVRPPSRIEDIWAKLGRPRPHPIEERRQLLDALGVPDSATVAFGNGHVSTVEEAEALRTFLAGRTATVILVTSPYHARRTKLVFESVIPSATFLVASPPEGRLADPWWRDQDSALRVLTESAKLAFFWLGGAFRKMPAP